MSRTLKVVSPGALSLVQDAGRYGYQRYGVSVSGAIDREALLIGNRLVGNEASAAAIEVMFGGAEFQFSDETIAAVTGCEVDLFLDGTLLRAWQSFVAPAGSVLRLGVPISGLRAYVSFSGGINTQAVLGSRSTHVSSGIGGQPLAGGDEIPLGAPGSSAKSGAKFPEQLRRTASDEIEIRVVRGPQESAFMEDGIRTFFSAPYTVTDQSDRQGLRLDGLGIEAIDGRYDIISDAVAFGAIQVPGDGKPIVLMSDRQTTGGYAKVAVVATVDLPLLAQARPGAVLRFTDVTVAEAQRLMRERHGAIMEADLFADMCTHRVRIGIGGSTREITVNYRGDELLEQGSGMVSVSIDGVHSTVRAQDISP